MATRSDPRGAEGRRLRRRLSAGLVAAAALCVAVVLAIAFWIESDAARAHVRSLLREQLALATGASVEIGPLRGSLLRQLSLDDIELRWPDRAALRIARIETRYRLSIDDGHLGLVVRELRLDAPVMHWERDPVTTWDTLLPTTAPEADELDEPPGVLDSLLAGAWIRLDTFEVNAGRIEWPAAEPDPREDGASPASVLAEAPQVEWTLQVASWSHTLGPPPAKAETSPTGVSDAEPSSGLGLSVPREARLSARWSRLPSAAYLAGPGKLDLAWDGERLTLREIEGTLDDMRVHGGGALVLDTDQHPSSAAIELEVAQLDLSRATPLTELESRLSGTLAARVQWKPEAPAEGLWPDGVLEADLEGAASGLAIERLALELAHRDGSWKLDRAELTGEAVRVEAASLPGDPARLHVAAQVPDLARFRAPGVPTLDSAGSLELDAELTVPPELDSLPHAGTLEVHGKNLSWRGAILGDLEAALRFAPDRVSLSEVRLGYRDEQLRVEGEIAPEGPVQLSIYLKQWTLERVLAALSGPIPIVRGRASGELRLAGTWTAPSVVGRLELARPHVDAFAARSATLTADGDAKQQAFALALSDLAGADAQLTLTLPRDAYERTLREPPASAGAWQTAAREAELRWDVQRVDLSWARRFAPPEVPDLHGLLSAQGQLRGGWPPRALEGEVRVTDLAVAPSEVPAQAEGGSWSLGDWSLRFGQTEKPSTAPSGSRRPAGSPVGGLNVQAEGGRAPLWRSSFRLDLEPDWLLGQPGDLRVDDARLEYAGAVAQARAAWVGDRLAQGSLRLGGVDLGREELAALATQLTGLAGPWGGRIDGELALDGPLAALDVGGALTWENPQIAGGHADRIAARVTTAQGSWQLDAEIAALAAQVASAHLALPRVPLDPLPSPEQLSIADANLTTRALDVALLAPLLPRRVQKPKGRLDIEITASGPLSDPALSGYAELSEGSLHLPSLGQTFTPIRARLELVDGQIRLPSLRIAASAGGAAELSGALQLAGLEPAELDLRAHFDRWALARTRSFQFDMGGDASISGPLDRLAFGGELLLLDARLGAPSDRDPIWDEIQVLREGSAVTELREDAERPPSLWETTQGKLRVKIPGQAWVRAAGAQLELVGDVELRKKPRDAARLFGKLEVRRGHYQLGRRLLQIERGTASLTGATEPDPTLDVLAVSEIRDYRVELALQGRTSNPLLTFRSDPPLERNDILSLLLFGRTNPELEATRSMALELALAQFGSEIGADELRAGIARFLPFETFAVEVDDETTSARVEVGTYLREDVFVEYGRDLGTEGDDEVQVEWKLTPSIRIESSTSTDGSSGADIIWKKDY